MYLFSYLISITFSSQGLLQSQLSLASHRTVHVYPQQLLPDHQSPIYLVRILNELLSGGLLKTVVACLMISRVCSFVSLPSRRK